jgi:YaiO family outer membrane protein
MPAMKKIFLMVSIILTALLSVSSGTLAAQEMPPAEKALQALHGQDYQTVITICLDQLTFEPDNYDFNFLLSRAYAYSGQRDQALDLLNKMLASHPENNDLLLFKSRVQSWDRNFQDAESGYQKVLERDPRNTEAMTGIAEMASWQNRYPDAIQKYQRVLLVDPDNADTYFRIGRVYQWGGNFQKAKENYQKAIELDPDNLDYQQALRNARPVFRENFELRYFFINEGFSDGRDSYKSHFLYFSIKISPNTGDLQLRYNQTQRFGESDAQFGVELYPHLWKHAYGHFDFSYSSKAVHYPETSYMLEVYQSFPASLEVSLGYRRMNFPAEAISIYLGSLGVYTGNIYSFLRWYYSPEDIGKNFSWLVNVRRYFSDDNYVALGFGWGSRPFEIETIEDVSVKQSWIFLAEWEWYFLKKIGLKVQFTHRDEQDGPTRNSIFIGTGYRW